MAGEITAGRGRPHHLSTDGLVTIARALDNIQPGVAVDWQWAIIRHLYPAKTVQCSIAVVHRPLLTTMSSFCRQENISTAAGNRRANINVAVLGNGASECRTGEDQIT